MITPVEVQLGLVARFDPERLLENGAAPACPPMRAVRGPHYFMCVGGPFGPWSVWIPAFSRYRPGRIKLGFKDGSSDWVGPDSYVDLVQMWHIPDRALGPATASVDYTSPRDRNYASWRFLFGETREATDPEGTRREDVEEPAPAMRMRSLQASASAS
jgi:hypothetical protein